MLNIRDLVAGYNRSARGLPELLPWMCLWDEETVATVDQGMLAVYEYAGIDAEGRSDSEMEVAVNAFERAFSGFGSGSTVWSYVDRRKSKEFPSGSFKDPVASFINDTWSEAVTQSQYQNRYGLAIHQRSNTGSMALFDTMDLLVKEEGLGLTSAFIKAAKTQFSLRGRKNVDTRRMLAAKQALEERLSLLEAGMSSLGLRRLKGEALLADLFNRACPATPRREGLPVPKIPAFLSTLLCSDDLKRHHDHLVFRNADDKYVGVVSLKGFNGDVDTRIGQLDWLTAIDGEITVAHCFRFIDRDVAQKTIEDIHKYNIAKSVPFFHRLMCSFAKKAPTKHNDGRLALAEDAKAALVELYQSNRAFGHHNLTILCYGDTYEEMARVRKMVIERLTTSRFIGHVERMHQLSAFTQTLPGQWAASVRWNFVSYGNIADIAPIRTLWTGPRTIHHFEKELRRPFPALTSIPTTAGTPFYPDLWEIGVGHMKIIGPTRMGKSTATNFLLSQFRKFEPCRTVVIDKDYSCFIPTLLQGGIHIDLNREARNASRMAPLSLVGDPRHHPFLVSWFKDLIEAGRPLPCTPQEIERITAAIRGLADLKDPALWRLSKLGPGLGPDLAAYLGQWIEGGANGSWFDNPAQPMDLGNHVCFECKDMFSNQVVAAQAMSYLFYLIEKLLDDTPTIVSIEETWFFLDNQRFVQRIDNFLRTLGKRNGSLWIVTQNQKEIDECAIRNSLMSNVPNTLYLPDPNIKVNAELYREAGLLDEEIDRIAQATPKRHYYLKTASVNRMLDLSLPEEIVACIGSGSRARQTFHRHYATRDENPGWKESYFKEMMNV